MFAVVRETALPGVAGYLVLLVFGAGREFVVVESARRLRVLTMIGMRFLGRNDDVVECGFVVWFGHERTIAAEHGFQTPNPRRGRFEGVSRRPRRAMFPMDETACAEEEGASR